jgi:hypothetical protein
MVGTSHTAAPLVVRTEVDRNNSERREYDAT